MLGAVLYGESRTGDFGEIADNGAAASSDIATDKRGAHAYRGTSPMWSSGNITHFAYELSIRPEGPSIRVEWRGILRFMKHPLPPVL